jgi:hypothetical protein
MKYEVTHSKDRQVATKIILSFEGFSNMKQNNSKLSGVLYILPYQVYFFGIKDYNCHFIAPGYLVGRVLRKGTMPLFYYLVLPANKHI